MRDIRFVVTVDVDTMLPPGSVAKLVGTLAHPLNQPRFDPESGRITAGYSIVQPRVEISPQSGTRTLFARLFTGDTAIDIYSRAVSEVYQDLMGAGTFVGKGIYDLAAFHRSVDGRVPENRILSHDLFEGAHGRAALATDIVLYEGFPANYLEYVSRLHRWIRGDWQLLAWLGRRVPGASGEQLSNRIAGIDRWKMVDNLRRSLVAPGLLLLALGGWFFLPGSPWFWTVLVLFAPAGQLLTDLVSGLARGRRRGASYGLFSRLSDQAGRWFLAIVFLLHEALMALHAIGVTLWRTLFSHRNLLEWTTAAHIAGRLGDQRSRIAVWRQMAAGPALAAGVAASLLLLRPSALPAALPLLFAWFAAPEITLRIGRPRRTRLEPLGEEDEAFLRRLARKTWFYFESFAGPEENWLPPDNYQGEPHEEIAHRTSPTNIGMMLLSTATAWDLGYLGRSELTARTRNVFESLAQLERYRGHFFNWYETRHLKPLEPRYVSTVDSGNLAVSFLAYAATLHEAAAVSGLEPQRWQGLRDVLDLLDETLSEIEGGPGALQKARVLLDKALAGIEARPETWHAELRELCHTGLVALERAASQAVEGESALPAESVRDLFAWLGRLRHQAQTMQRDLAARAKENDELHLLADEAVALAQTMDFTSLYDQERRLFHIGHNVSAGHTDSHHYDLLASEARLASYFAIAKGDVPTEHWFHLERPVTRAPGGLSLISWNGSMFEYLMPRLLLRSEAETLLGESERVAVEIQRRYGEESRVPWGISESAYAARDPEHRFRYQAFGVPGLGLRRGLARDMVVAPYASALALAVAPGAAAANLRRIAELGAGGRFGLWEAVDFTRDRRMPDMPFAPVNAFMAHHQGMILCAIGNALLGDRLVERFGRNPQVRLISLLLSERVPREISSEIERIEVIDHPDQPAARLPLPASWEPARSPFPEVHLLGNGRLASWVSESGGGGLRWHGQALTRFVPDATRDADGLWLYLRDEESGALWSATRQPTGAPGEQYSAVFHPHLAEFHRRDQDIDLRLEIGVGADDDLEIRRLTILNESDHLRRL
ncbi:MAG: glucoamylase family protein, partial [Parasphingopyxis sp.]